MGIEETNLRDQVKELKTTLETERVANFKRWTDASVELRDAREQISNLQSAGHTVKGTFGEIMRHLCNFVENLKTLESRNADNHAVYRHSWRLLMASAHTLAEGAQAVLEEYTRLMNRKSGYRVSYPMPANSRTVSSAKPDGEPQSRRVVPVVKKSGPQRRLL